VDCGFALAGKASADRGLERHSGGAKCFDGIRRMI
jgi:hypothetical protein